MKTQQGSDCQPSYKTKQHRWPSSTEERLSPCVNCHLHLEGSENVRAEDRTGNMAVELPADCVLRCAMQCHFPRILLSPVATKISLFNLPLLIRQTALSLNINDFSFIMPSHFLAVL